MDSNCDSIGKKPCDDEELGHVTKNLSEPMPQQAVRGHNHREYGTKVCTWCTSSQNDSGRVSFFPKASPNPFTVVLLHRVAQESHKKTGEVSATPQSHLGAMCARYVF